MESELVMSEKQESTFAAMEAMWQRRRVFTKLAFYTSGTRRVRYRCYQRLSGAARSQ